MLQAELTERDRDIETLASRLEQERQRSSSLAKANSALKLQLSQSQSDGQSLAADLERSTVELQRVQDDVTDREARWATERRSLNDYISREQGRILALWRDVAAVRADFNDRVSSIKRDLAQMKCDLSSSIFQVGEKLQHRLLAFASPSSEAATIEARLRDQQRQETRQLQTKFEAQCNELSTRVSELTAINERLKSQLNDRQRQIEQLTSDMESRRATEPATDSLLDALRHITQCAADEDSTDGGLENGGSGRGLSPTRCSDSIRALSPSRCGGDAMLVCVQTALQRRRQQIVELRSRAESMKGQLTSRDRRVSELDEERRRLEQELSSIKADRDNALKNRESIERRHTRVRDSLDAATSCNIQLESTTQSLSEHIERLQIDNRRLVCVVEQLERRLVELEEERDELLTDIGKHKQETIRCRQASEQLEKKVSSLKTETVSLKETVEKTQLEKDLLERHNTELKQRLSAAEKQSSESKQQLNQTTDEITSLRDNILKLRVLNEELSKDKLQANSAISKLEKERSSLLSNRNLLQQDVQGLREELVRVERERVEIAMKKSGTTYNLHSLEQLCMQLEDKLRRVVCERDDLLAQVASLGSQLTVMSDELSATRHELSSAETELGAVATDRDRRLGDADTRLAEAEADRRRLCESIVQLKVDHREALDRETERLRDVNCVTDERFAQLQREKQQVEGSNSRLQDELRQLATEMTSAADRAERQRSVLEQQLVTLEGDFQAALQRERMEREEQVDHVTRDKEALRAEFDVQRNRLIGAHNSEFEELTTRHAAEVARLERELTNALRCRDEQLLIVETSKQQMLSDIERDRLTLRDQLSTLQSEFDVRSAELQRLKQEMTSQRNNDSDTIARLEDELSSLKSLYDSETSAHEAGLQELAQRAADTQRHCDAALQEVSELGVQLRMTEETRDSLRRDLLAAKRRVKEVEDICEMLNNDLSEAKQRLSEETLEKEASQKSAKELRNTVKRIEGEKVELNHILIESKARISSLEETRNLMQKEITSLKSSLHDVEAARLEAQRAAKDAKRRAKLAESEQRRLTEEIEKLHSDVAGGLRLVDDLRHENCSLHRQLMEITRHHEGVSHQLDDLERVLSGLRDEVFVKDQQYARQLDDFRQIELGLGDRLRTLELALDASGASVAELQARVTAGDHHVRELEAELSRVELARQDAAFKLESLSSSVWRAVRDVGCLGRHRTRSPSPRRLGRSSPVNDLLAGDVEAVVQVSRHSSRSPSRASNLDCEQLLDALHDLVTTLKDIDMERNEAVSTCEKLSQKLKEADEQRNQVQYQLQTNLQVLQDDKSDVDSRLTSAQRALLLQEDVLRASERDRKQLAEKLSNVERAHVSTENSNVQFQEKLSKLSSQKASLEDEVKQMRGKLEESESQLSRCQLTLRAVEGDLHRMELVLNDRDCKIMYLQDQLCSTADRAQKAEGGVHALQSTVDKLTATLDKNNNDKIVHQQRAEDLNSSLNEQTAVINVLHDRLSHTKTALDAVHFNTRHELADTVHELKDLQRENTILMEQVSSLRLELSTMQSWNSELQNQLQQANNRVSELQDKTQDLTKCNDRLLSEKTSLIDTLAQLRESADSSRQQIELLKSQIDRKQQQQQQQQQQYTKVTDSKMYHESVGSRSVDRHETSRLKKENAELQTCIRQLEQQLMDAEHEHSQRLLELTSHHDKESMVENEKIRSAQKYMEHKLRKRERDHLQRVASLEEQIGQLRHQLDLPNFNKSHRHQTLAVPAIVPDFTGISPNLSPTIRGRSPERSLSPLRGGRVESPFRRSVSPAARLSPSRQHVSPVRVSSRK